MRIGSIELGSRPVFLAPMEDVTDTGFRLLCKRFGASMVYTEFVSAEALVRDVKSTVRIVGAKCGSNSEGIAHSYDDNELSEWKSDGKRENAWVTYQLERKAKVDELALKLTGWRNKCYPLAVYAGKQLVWEGITPATLGYAHIYIDQPVSSDQLTIRMLGPSQASSKFGDVKELAGGNAGELDRVRTAKGSVDLRIVEVDLLEKKP